MTARQSFATSVLANAVLFTFLGATSRYAVRFVETRWQIAMLAAFAVLVETTVWTSLTMRSSWVRGVVGVAAAALSITAMKFVLEPKAKTRAATHAELAVKSLIDAALSEEPSSRRPSNPGP